MAEAEQAGNPAFLMAADHLLGVCLEFAGDMTESSRVLDRGRELHDPEQHRAYTETFGLDPGMIARAMSSRPLWILGYPDRAEARARETLQLARSQRQPMTLVFALLVTQGVHLVRGEASEALMIGDEVVALCNEFGLPQEREWSRSFQGAALAALGRLDEGIAQLSDSLAVQRAIGAGLVRSAFLGVLADLLRFAGREDDALSAVNEGFTHAEQYGEGGYLSELHRAKAELLRLKGDIAGAEAGFAAAVDYARGQQARSFELRAATGWAQTADRVRPPRRSARRARAGLCLVHRRPGDRGPLRGTRDARAESVSSLDNSHCPDDRGNGVLSAATGRFAEPVRIQTGSGGQEESSCFLVIS